MPSERYIELVAEYKSNGMDEKEARNIARMQVMRESKKNPAARAPKKKTPTKKKSSPRKVKKSDVVIPDFVKSFNVTTRAAWVKAQSTDSRKNAIRATCLLCVGGSGTEVKNCTAENSCPLWKYRITG